MAEEFLRIDEVKKLIGLGESSIWFKLNPKYPNRYDPTFPKPVRVAGHAVRWPRSEIEAWQVAKMAQRD